MYDRDFLARLARQVGEAILEVYGTEFEVRHKEDHSPVTLADMRSHRIITDALRSRYPDIPVLSEEGKAVPFEVRSTWKRFWLVDPLDGTKEFVKKNGEFTVNIALIAERTPVVGVIYIPVENRLFMAEVGEGCWEMDASGPRSLKVSEPVADVPVRIVRSRSHPAPGLEMLLDVIPRHEILNRGSSLKFCAVAAGEADFYPRFGPTWEWDTAAGHAIVAAAGGIMLELSGMPFLYNKPSLVNGPFLVASSLRWLRSSGVIGRVAGS